MEKPAQKSRVLKWSLIISITIVLNLFFNYALSVVYHAPDYENFCPSEQVNKNYTSQSECVSAGGQWTDYTPAPGDNQKITGYCNPDFTCGNNFTSALKTYERNVFVTLVILGVISIGISFAILNIAVSQGLALGGTLSFVIASMRYWGSAEDIVKVLILAVALAGLIYIAYKKFGNSISA